MVNSKRYTFVSGNHGWICGKCNNMVETEEKANKCCLVLSDSEVISVFVEELNNSQKERFKAQGYTNECFFKGEDLQEQHKFNIKEKIKYIYIDCGNSGYFMIVKETMEIFGIKAYGTINKVRYYGKIGEVKGDDVLRLKEGGSY